MKTLVTGGAGFIGSNLVKHLCDERHKVVVIDDFSSSGGRIFKEPRAKIFRGSFGDEKLLRKLLKGQDVVFHLAATGIIKKSLENPLSYFKNNFLNGVKLLDAMRSAGVKKIIYSSSSGAYGEPKKIPICEDDIKEPVNPYGASKLAYEHVLSSYWHAFGIESVSLRYFNVYGPGDEQRPVTRAVPMWIKAVLKNEEVPIYWGGKQIKDYIYVSDVVSANMLAAKRGRGCAVYNVGSGKGIKMIDVARAVEKASGLKLKIIDGGNRAGDPSVLIADTNKIEKELGWKPKVGLEDGLRFAIEYYKKN